MQVTSDEMVLVTRSCRYMGRTESGKAFYLEYLTWGMSGCVAKSVSACLCGGCQGRVVLGGWRVPVPVVTCFWIVNVRQFFTCYHTAGKLLGFAVYQMAIVLRGCMLGKTTCQPNQGAKFKA